MYAIEARPRSRPTVCGSSTSRPTYNGKNAVTIPNHKGPQFSAARGISSRTAEFGIFPRLLSRGINRGIRLLPRNFDVFHSNNYFFTENDLKVALLQVCL